MKEYTIEEVRVAKKELEDTIENLVSAFTAVYKVSTSGRIDSSECEIVGEYGFGSQSSINKIECNLEIKI